MHVVLYECETWSLTLRAQGRLRIVLRIIFELKRDEVKGNGEDYVMRSLEIFTPYKILFG